MIESHYIYWLIFALMMIGLYVVISHGNMLKKMIGLTLFQASVFLFYISLGKVEGGTAPIITEDAEKYSHPLPQVLILTAIVVGVATLAVGLALIVRVFESYGSIEEDEVLARDAAELEATEDSEPQQGAEHAAAGHTAGEGATDDQAAADRNGAAS